MNSFKIVIFDLFFIVSAIIGVGFATGKEIAHFFLGGKSLVLAVIVFFCVFVGLCSYILHIKNKHKLNNLTQLNKFAFGKHYEVANIVLVVLFIVTNSAMLAGCDNLVKTYLGLNSPVISLFLSCVTFFIALGGVKRIKSIANIVMPILIIVIFLNACINLKPTTLNGNIAFDICYPIIFCAENFITLISVLISTKSRPLTLSLISGLIISVVILFSAIAIGNLNADMPMISLSKNGGFIFFGLYLLGVIFALFTTLQISVYHCMQVTTKSTKNKIFNLLMILLVSQIIAYLGFNFIVLYLYSAVGILGAVYLIVLITRLVISNKKYK